MKYIAFIGLFLLFACESDQLSNDNKNKTNPYSTIVSFEKIDSIAIPVESGTIFDTQDILLFEQAGEKYLSILDDKNRMFFTYTWPGLKVASKFALEREGPNGLGSISSTYFSFTQTSKDSIFFWNSNYSTFYLFNSKGELKSKYIWNLDSIKTTKSPFLNCALPIKQNKSGFFMASLESTFRLRNPNYSQSGAVGVFLLENSKIKNTNFMFHYPKSYDDGYYCTEPYLYAASFEWNEDLNLYMVSFPIEESIILYDKNGNIVKDHKVKSKYIDKIKPMRNKKFLANVAKRKVKIPNVTERAEYLWSTSYYSYMFRVGKIKINGRVTFLNKPSRKVSDFSIILFDDSFNILGEFDFDGEKYLVDRFFIVDDTVYILNDKKTYSDEREKYMYFDGFKISER